MVCKDQTAKQAVNGNMRQAIPRAEPSFISRPASYASDLHRGGWPGVVGTDHHGHVTQVIVELVIAPGQQVQLRLLDCAGIEVSMRRQGLVRINSRRGI
jgi:hypothetical protein